MKDGNLVKSSYLEDREFRAGTKLAQVYPFRENRERGLSRKWRKMSAALAAEGKSSRLFSAPRLACHLQAEASILFMQAISIAFLFWRSRNRTSAKASTLAPETKRIS